MAYRYGNRHQMTLLPKSIEAYVGADDPVRVYDENKRAMKELTKQCTRICMELDLIDGNVLFVDGTKIRANASWDNNLSFTWERRCTSGDINCGNMF